VRHDTRGRRTKDLVLRYSSHVGAFIMLCTLVALIALVLALVLVFDPQARRRPGRPGGDDD
jgi:hypothetical protein